MQDGHTQECVLYMCICRNRNAIIGLFFFLLKFFKLGLKKLFFYKHSLVILGSVVVSINNSLHSQDPQRLEADGGSVSEG